MYRMIAIDLDGTLLSPAGVVTPAVKDAVHRALGAGLLVCFATGRNWTESRMVLDAIEHYDTAVFVGGAMVVDTKSGSTLHRQLMEPSLAREVSAALEQAGQVVLAMQDTAASGGIDYVVTDGISLNDATATWMEATSATVKRVPSLAAYDHTHTVRLGIVAEVAVSADMQRTLDAQFGSRVVMQAIRIPAFGVDVLEVFDPAVNKWQGLLHVARQRGILPEEIIAVGDDINDLAMIGQAGLGVAMGNARDIVKQTATRIIGTNADDGLATFIHELIDAGLVKAVATG